MFTPLNMVQLFGVSKVAASFFVHRNVKRKFIKKLRRGLYILADAAVPDAYIANRLYEPSYLSLEFALSYHRVIPETVYELTSVTTKATRRFLVDGKSYSYRKIKRDAFTGYQSVRRNGYTFIIADPEKAFVDATYLRIIRNKIPLSRFDKKKINKAKAIRYARLFNNNKLIAVIHTTLL